MTSPPKKALLVGVAVVCCLLMHGGSPFLSQQTAAGKRWTVSSFLEFSQGTLGDAGVNTYVTAAGEVQLINLWDLNRDGFIDIVLPNTHDNNQQIDLFIYWGVDEDHVSRRTRLPSDGGTSQVLGDLNRDGFTDLVVANGENGIKPNLDSYLYWGGAPGVRGPNVERNCPPWEPRPLRSETSTGTATRRLFSPTVPGPAANRLARRTNPFSIGVPRTDFPPSGGSLCPLRLPVMSPSSISTKTVSWRSSSPTKAAARTAAVPWFIGAAPEGATPRISVRCCRASAVLP